MCKAIYEMIEEGREEGREEGKAEGMEKGRNLALNAIRVLMTSLDKTAEDAMALIGIPVEEQDKYLQQL